MDVPCDGMAFPLKPLKIRRTQIIFLDIPYYEIDSQYDFCNRDANGARIHMLRSHER